MAKGPMKTASEIDAAAKRPGSKTDKAAELLIVRTLGNAVLKLSERGETLSWETLIAALESGIEPHKDMADAALNRLRRR